MTVDQAMIQYFLARSDSSLAASDLAAASARREPIASLRSLGEVMRAAHERESTALAAVLLALA